MPLEEKNQGPIDNVVPQLVELDTLSYRQQVVLLKPVLNIKPIAKISAKIVDSIINSISAVAAEVVE